MTTLSFTFTGLPLEHLPLCGGSTEKLWNAWCTVICYKFHILVFNKTRAVNLLSCSVRLCNYCTYFRGMHGISQDSCSQRTDCTNTIKCICVFSARASRKTVIRAEWQYLVHGNLRSKWVKGLSSRCNVGPTVLWYKLLASNGDVMCSLWDRNWIIKYYFEDIKAWKV
jgi:hypothetical protein